MSQFVPLSQGFGKTAQDINNSFGVFENNKYVSGTKAFLQSNSIVAKVAFLLLVVILFVLLLRLGTSIITWAMSPNKSPKLVDGMIQGTKSKVIPQDPKQHDAITIMRSKNQNDGIEFTYSVWLFIENLKDEGKFKHIFHKGNDGFSNSGGNMGMNYPNNAPGLYLGKDPNNLNSLVVVMNTYDPTGSDSNSNDVSESVVINDIPLNKWFNVIIRVDGRKLDTYINGTIVNRRVLNGVPKQNYGDVYVNMNGGFDGLLSDLWYHDYGLSVGEIQRLMDKGPNMKMDKSMDIYPPYLSLKWYFDQ